MFQFLRLMERLYNPIYNAGHRMNQKNTMFLSSHPIKWHLQRILINYMQQSRFGIYTVHKKINVEEFKYYKCIHMYIQMLLKKEKTGISVEEEYKTLKCIEEIYNTAQENIRVKIDDFIETLFDKNELELKRIQIYFDSIVNSEGLKTNIGNSRQIFSKDKFEKSDRFYSTKSNLTIISKSGNLIVNSTKIALNNNVTLLEKKKVSYAIV
ncbi:hypothetical protein [Leptospira interrogans]|uniref:hypothetical protein n=2 Tax=Leptospira interrogans TaxID=173 RepID=UPI00137AAE42|nr:hypothetical protein [Leptospira interrogans]